MTTPDNAALLEQARKFIGQSAGRSATARDPVNVPMIRRWCEAMGETNRAFVDAEAARTAGFDGVVAPPAMLDVWTMSPYKPGGRTVDDGFNVLTLFDAAGYTGVVATNVVQEYDRYLAEGDVVSFTVTVAEVSDEKRTGLGIGHFVTLHYEFTDQTGASVGRMDFRVLKFKPPVVAAPAPVAGEAPKFSHPRPGVTHDNAHYWDGIANRKLLIQKCSSCGTLRHPPGPACPACHSLEWEAIEASGKATLHSFVMVHQPKLPSFDYPHPVLLVELEEGVRLVANARDLAAEDLVIGMPLELDFFEVEPGYLLPAFRAAKG